MVVGDRKYIHSSSPELYDSARDRAELENLVTREPAVAERLRALLFEAFPEALASAPAPTVRPGPEDLTRLQALGYLGGGASPAAERPRVAPQVMMPVLTRVALAEEGDKPLEQRVAELRAVLDEHPDFLPAWKGLANVYRGAERLEEAAGALEHCLALSPGTPQAVFELALVRANQGLDAEALRLLEPVVDEYPSFVEPRYLYGTVLGRMRRIPEAIEHLRAVFELAPEHERCVEHLVGAYLIAGRRAELVDLLQEHLEAHPGAARVRLALEQL